MMPELSAKYIFGIILKQLHAPPSEETIHYLAVQLLQRALTTGVNQEGGIDTLVQSMLALLDESRDATSKAVVGFLAEYAARYLHLSLCCHLYFFSARKPEAILDDLFMRLDDPDKMKRHNALDILTEIFKINKKPTNNVELRYYPTHCLFTNEP